MDKDTYVRFFETFLLEASRGHGGHEYVNPALQFVEQAKAGALDGCSDALYERKLREVEALSAFWRNEPDRTVSDVLCAALAQTKLEGPALNNLSRILASSVKNAPPSGGRPENAEKPALSSGAAEERARRLPSPALYSGHPKEAPRFRSPGEIYELLRKRVYGQDSAVKAAAMLLYNHQLGRRRNLLFLGPTGCGKTEIWRACRQLHPGVRIIDSTILTGETWKGDYKIANIFDGMTQEEAEHAVIVLDEFDKLCEPQISGNGASTGQTVQNELLKPIEGGVLKTKRFDVDTSNVSFVFCGSFERLTQVKTAREAGQSIGFGADLTRRDNHRVYEAELGSADLVKHANVRQEIAGRIHQIVQLDPMAAEDFRAILADERLSPLHKLEREYGVKLRLDDETAGELAREAAETRMGVRYLHSRLQQMLDEQLFRDCGRAEYELGA